MSYLKYEIWNREIGFWLKWEYYNRSTRLTNRFFYLLPRINLRTGIYVYRTIEWFFLLNAKNIHKKKNRYLFLISTHSFLNSSLSYCWPSIKFTLSICINRLINLKSNKKKMKNSKSAWIQTIRRVWTVLDRISDVQVSIVDRAWTCIGWSIYLENDEIGCSVSLRHVSTREWGSIWIGRLIGFLKKK